MMRILFYQANRPYGWLSNFSPHGFHLDGHDWTTVEHYFQAQKFEDPLRKEEIRLAPTPALAKRLGRRAGIRDDWPEYRLEVMRRAVTAKFAQHVDLCAKLVATEDAWLVEAAPRDAFWGSGADGTGQNQLGQILMQVRGELARTDRDVSSRKTDR